MNDDVVLTCDQVTVLRSMIDDCRDGKEQAEHRLVLMLEYLLAARR